MDSQVIQIDALQSLLGVLGIILAIGIAWGSLRTKVDRIDNDVEDIKRDVKSSTKDIAAIKAVVMREHLDNSLPKV